MKAAIIQCPVWGTYDPPIALAQLSACLKKAGHEVSASDLNIKFYLNRPESYKNMWAWEQSGFWYNQESVDGFFVQNHSLVEKYISEILKTKPEVVGFSVNAASHLASLKIASQIRGKNRDTKIVFGGPLFFEQRFIESILDEGIVDFIISGEGEDTLVNLVNALEEKTDIADCPGLFFKNNGRLINTGNNRPIVNLDSLPFLDFSDLLLSDYDDSKHISFSASRGCIQRCAFCSSRAFWSGYRSMSGERIFKEIKFQVNKLRKSYPDLYHIDFIDLLFNGNMKSLVTFCDLVIDSGLKIFWSANMIIRPEMDKLVIQKMRDSGCEHIIFGVESGSQKVLDLMRKIYHLEDADRILKIMHDCGIKVTANFMFGFPGETEDDFQQTLNFIKRNAQYLDRVYPSRTFFAIEEFSYLAAHLCEFDIKGEMPNHLYWESKDGKNTYPERMRRCEEFCYLASSLGIEVGSGVQTSVELDRYFNLGHYYESQKDWENSRKYFLKYYELDKKNEVVLNKLKDSSRCMPQVINGQSREEILNNVGVQK
jgi:radical SAM superfamily enzyme YgiQ (UPF0313 family)